MLSIDDYLDRALSYSRLPSDRAISRAMGVTASCVNGWRMKRQWPDDAHIVTLARLAGIDPAQALLDLNIWRVKSPIAREEYQKIFDKLTSAAAAILIMIAAQTANAETKAEQISFQNPVTIHYAIF